MKYRCIAADPPWNESGGGKSKRGADRHYPLMKTADIIDTMAQNLNMTARSDLFGQLEWRHLKPSKVADSAHMWLWVTDNFLEDGLRVLKALDFRYVRTLVWVKMDVDDDGVADQYRWEVNTFDPSDHLQIGLGQYARGAHELCLLGVRGDACLPPTDKRRPSVEFAKRERHSAKPQLFYDRFRECSPGPHLEMFARDKREGWDVWGNEV